MHGDIPEVFAKKTRLYTGYKQEKGKFPISNPRERVKKASNSKELAELFREKLFFAAFPPTLPTGRQANEMEDK